MSDQQAQALAESGAPAAESATPTTERSTERSDRTEGDRAFKVSRENREAHEKRAGSRHHSAEKPSEKMRQADGEQIAAGAPAAEAAKPWEAPKWSARWNQKARDAATFLANNPELRPHWDALQAQVDEMYQFNGKTENELGRWRQQMGPLSDMLTPYAQHWQMQGMTPQQGLSQILAYNDALTRDPDSALPQLAQVLPKPRDAAKVLQALSQAWGADIAQVAQGAPYVDPAISQMVSPLMQELQALKAQNFQREQYGRQQQQHFMLQQIDAFEQAVDDKGNRKHPFFREMFSDMVAHANARVQVGQPVNIEDVYNQVAAWHPAAAEWRAKQGAERALANASRTNDAAKQASDASRNVSGSKANGREAPPTTRMEAMKRAAKELGME